MSHDHSQQLFQGQGTEVYRDEDRLLHHTNNAQRLGASALIGIDPFMVARKSHRIHVSPATLEADRQSVVESAFKWQAAPSIAEAQEQAQKKAKMSDEEKAAKMAKAFRPFIANDGYAAHTD
jgi:hypothetical protein